jgi:hypothetical protein
MPRGQIHAQSVCHRARGMHRTDRVHQDLIIIRIHELERIRRTRSV